MRRIVGKVCPPVRSGEEDEITPERTGAPVLAKWQYSLARQPRPGSLKLCSVASIDDD